MLDSARNHLIWTVVIGVASVAILTLFSLFGHSTVTGWIAQPLAVASRVVAASLRTFNAAVAILKA